MKLLIITQKVDINDDLLGFFHDWIKEFSRNCEKVTVICLYKGEYNLPDNVKVLSLGKEEFSEKFVSSIKSKVHKVYKVKSRLIYLFNFFKYIWREKKNYDSVFVHMNPEYVVYGGLFWRLIGKKIGLWFTHKSVNIKLRIAEIFTNIIFTASKESFRLKSKKIKVVGHGIDANRFKPDTTREENKILKIITIGRISPIKDYETLIKAAEILKSENLEFKIDIIGGPGTEEQKSYFEKIKNLVREKKLDDNIKFLGSVPNKDILPYLQQADLFVHTSQTGSLDKAILEAMSCGVLTISSNDASFSILERISDKLIFGRGDYEELASKIEGIIKLDIEKNNIIKNKIRMEVQKSHSLEKLIKKIISIYNY